MTGPINSVSPATVNVKEGDIVSTEHKLLQASLGALRSYQYGNSSPDLAETLADHIDSFLHPSPARPEKEKLVTHIWIIQIRNLDGIWFNAAPSRFFATKRSASGEMKLLAKAAMCLPGSARVTKFVEASHD